MLAFDLHVPGLDKIIHAAKTAEFRPVRLKKGSSFFDEKALRQRLY